MTPFTFPSRLSRTVAMTAAILSLWGCAVGPLPIASARQDADPGTRAVTPAKAWLEGAVLYGVVPPLFGHRPFQDVAAKVPYLKEMGVDAVWLSPINATDDPSGISYAVTDYFDVREDFGTKADFKRMVDASHRAGIKVLMDFVPNHSSTGHPFYQDAEKRGPASPYFGFYVRDEEGRAQHYFDWENLKNLDFDNPAVQQHVTDAFVFWVKEMGVDGFRIDAAWGVKDRTPAYWSKLCQTLNAINPEVFLLAEASARDPYYVKNGFDAAYDWNKQLGHWSWEKVWEEPNQAGARLRQALAGKETPPERIARFLNNNDTGERFITRYGVAQQRVAAVLLHTLPGIPVVYTGDEVGAEFEPYEDPAPISWEDPHGLRPLYKRLAELREKVPALRAGHWSEVKVDAPGAYAFVRDAGERGSALTMLNFGQAATIRFTLPQGLATDARFTDAITGKPVPVKAGPQGLSVAMPAASALILTP